MNKKIKLALVGLMCLNNLSYAEETIILGPIEASTNKTVNGGIYQASGTGYGARIMSGATLTNVDADLTIRSFGTGDDFAQGVYMMHAGSTFTSPTHGLTVEATSQNNFARGALLTGGSNFDFENQTVKVTAISNSTATNHTSYGIILTDNNTTAKIGDGSEITTSTNASSAYGVHSYNQTTFSGGDYVTVSASSEGRLSGGVVMWDKAQATLGDHLIVKTSSNSLSASNDSTVGLWAYLEGKITVGDDARITSTGTNNAVAQGITTRAQGEIITGDRLTVIAQSENNEATGIHAYDYTNVYGAHDNMGGKVHVGKDANIQVSSLNNTATGVYARGTGSEITLDGGATISALQGSNQELGNAVQVVDRGVITANLGKYTIIGDIKSKGGYVGLDPIEGGTVDIQYAEGSYWKGKSLSDDTSTTNFTMTGTTWDMTGNSQVNHLEFSGAQSNINFIGEGGYQQLTVEDLGGDNGHFAMRVDIPNQTGDYMQVTGTSAGNHQVTIQNNGGSDVSGNEQFTIIETADGIASFQDTGAVELGGYQYQLRDKAGTQQKEWEIYGTKKPTTTTEASVHAFSGGYLLNYVETQTLLKRMGDLREGDSKGNIWARTYGGKFNSSGDGFLNGYDLKYWGLQVGADKKFSLKDGKGDIYLGGMFGYSKGDLDYGSGSGDVDSKTLGVYGTYLAPSGFYTDLVLKYSWMKDKFQVLDSQGMRVTGDDLKTDGLSASVEIGKRFHFNQEKKDGWYLEPQAQLSWGHQSGGTFTASNGLKVKADSYESVLGRIGTHIGYEVKGGKNPINVYGKVSFVHEFDGDMDYRLNNSRESVSFGDSWWTYGVGITAQVGKKHNIYLDIERAEGGSFTQEWAINGGYRFSW